MAKKQTSSNQEAESNSTGVVAKLKEFREYFELSKVEMRKVTWPTFKETRQASIVVLGFVAVMVLFLGLVDIGWSKLVTYILSV